MKCGKVKNPCKICLESVSNKTGLQCKGACKKWAHYKCLNFTPGKISDIKAGIIKVTCPCPDCTTTEPREILTNPPYTCTNQQCPATKLPSCESTDCPSKQKPIPTFQPPLQIPHKTESPLRGCQQPQNTCPPQPPLTGVQLKTCPSPPRLSASPPRRPSPPKRTASPPRRPGSPPRRPCSPPRRPGSPPRRQGSPPRRPASPPRHKATSRPACPSCPTHCPIKCPQSANTNKICSPQKSRSCSFMSNRSNDSGKTCYEQPRASSDSGLSKSQQDQKMMVCAIEEMCHTVGQLSNQLKELMCKMMNTFENANKNKC